MGFFDIFIAISLFGVVGYSFVDLMSAYRRKKWISEIETTPIKDISKGGYYEVKGRVECDHPMAESDYQLTNLVFYTLKETEMETNNEDQWVQVKNSVYHEATSFFLNDGTGRVKVYPKGAVNISEEIYRNSIYEDSESREDVTCEGIRVGDMVYLLGYAGKKKGEDFFEFSQMVKNFKNGRRPYLIGNKSEEEILEEAESRFNYSMGCLVLALAIFLPWVLSGGCREFSWDMVVGCFEILGEILED